MSSAGTASPWGCAGWALASPRSRPAAREPSRWKTFAHLSGWKTQALADLIISQATRDDELRRRLLLEAAQSSACDLDLQTYRDAIDEAVAADPADVLPIYEREWNGCWIARTTMPYAQAVGLLRRSRALTLRLGDAGSFAKYVQKLRAVHKPKRNFIKLLDRAKW